jgi:hypothetical protein
MIDPAYTDYNKTIHFTPQANPVKNRISALWKEPIYQSSFWTKSFHATNIESSIKSIEQFDIRSSFPNELWELADNFPSTKIPYSDLQGDYVNSNYHIAYHEWQRFNQSLEVSLLTLLDLSEEPQVKAHSALSDVCAEMVERLMDIQTLAHFYGGRGVLKPEIFSALKLPNTLKNRLGIELRKIEREHLLEFLGNLAALTLNKSNTRGMQKIFERVFKLFGYGNMPDEKTKSQKITRGLEKLRDYINLRSPRQRANMGPGKTGVAEFIYRFCLDTLLAEEKNFLLQKMKGNEKLVDIAAARNIGGYHFVCDLLTDQGIATLDSIGSKKILGSHLFPDDDNLVLSESFYHSCKPLALDHITVPIQKDNNCYLSAGWLKFCVFLHFFEQLNG